MGKTLNFVYFSYSSLLFHSPNLREILHKYANHGCSGTSASNQIVILYILEGKSTGLQLGHKSNANNNSDSRTSSVLYRELFLDDFRGNTFLLFFTVHARTNKDKICKKLVYCTNLQILQYSLFRTLLLFHHSTMRPLTHNNDNERVRLTHHLQEASDPGFMIILGYVGNEQVKTTAAVPPW